jgi:hypothetical protein
MAGLIFGSTVTLEGADHASLSGASLMLWVERRVLETEICLPGRSRAAGLDTGHLFPNRALR